LAVFLLALLRARGSAKAEKGGGVVTLAAGLGKPLTQRVRIEKANGEIQFIRNQPG